MDLLAYRITLDGKTEHESQRNGTNANVVQLQQQES